MVTSTLLPGTLGVLSTFILDEFSISKSVYGLAFATYALVGGLSSIHIGELADKNARRVMAGLFISSVLGVVGAALAPSYILLLFAMALGGLALGAGNPVTNKIVAEHVPTERRGLVIGFKQAGPPLGIFLAGVALPPLAVALGWRTAVGLIVVVPLTGLVATGLLSAPWRTGGFALGEARVLDKEVRSVVRWLTAIGFGVAMGSSSLIAFLPLFAQEAVGMRPTAAGVVTAAMGLAGALGRIVWGALGGRFRRPSTALLIITSIATVSVLVVNLSSSLGSTWLWVGAVGSGSSLLAWHAVAWLVIIDRVDMSAVGRASGVMQMGSTIGSAAGAPLAGVILDLSDSYALTWSVVAVLMVIVASATWWFRVRAATARKSRLPGSGH